jgi:O-antigen ligase
VTTLRSSGRTGPSELGVLVAGCALAALAGPLVARSPTFVYGLLGLLVVLAVLAFSARWPAVDVAIVAVLVASALIDLPQRLRVGPTTGQGVETAALVAVMALLCLNGYAGRGVPSVRRLWPLGIFLLWASLSFSWGQVSQQGAQNVFVYLGFGGMLLIGATAGRWAPEHTFSVLDRGFMVAAVVGFALQAFSFAHGGHGNKFAVSPRPFGLFGVLIVAWFMAAHVSGVRIAKYFVAAAVLLTLLSLSRSALAAQLTIIVLAWVGTSTNFRTVIRAAGAFVIVGALALAAVFLYAPLNHRFFGGDKAQIGGISINVTGRDALWSANWHWFKEKPWIGWGAGASDKMTSALPGGVAGHPHNDYLRLLVDYGVVGLAFWLAAYVTLLVLTWRGWRRALPRGGLDMRIQCAAFLALTGIAMAMLVDNPLIEIAKMAPLGALAGLALGVSARRRAESAPAHRAAEYEPELSAV